MYDASPENKTELDYEKTREFVAKWDFSAINNVGFYGGEPSINFVLYQKFIDLLPKVPKFVITNGAWSTSVDRTEAFIEFIYDNDLYTIISGTKEHKMYQNEGVLRAIKENAYNMIRLKDGDVIHKMGRGKDYPGAMDKCSGFCCLDDRITRLAIMPDGNIVFQNCHGNYPIVQTIEDPFEGILERTMNAVKNCGLKLL